MNEHEVRAIFAKIKHALKKGREPKDADLLALAEGALVNLAKLANPPTMVSGAPDLAPPKPIR